MLNYKCYWTFDCKYELLDYGKESSFPQEVLSTEAPSLICLLTHPKALKEFQASNVNSLL